MNDKIIISMRVWKRVLKRTFHSARSESCPIASGKAYHEKRVHCIEEDRQGVWVALSVLQTKGSSFAFYRWTLLMAIQFISSHSSSWRGSLLHQHIQSKLAFECCRMNKTDINSISVLTEFWFSIPCSSDSSSSAEHIVLKHVLDDFHCRYAISLCFNTTNGFKRYYYIFKMNLQIITNNRSSSVQFHFNFNKLIAKFQFFLLRKNQNSINWYVWN